MNKLQTGLTAAALAAAFTVTSVEQSNAAPTFVPKTATAQSDAIRIRDGLRWNGYRGYRNFRPGYRYYNGLWFPAGAFLAGALIGGAINGGYYGNNYYGNGYYGNLYGQGYYANRYYPGSQYQQRVYYPSQNSYRQGYADGYRAGYYDGASGSISCTQRLAASGRC